jgi:small GTP-binding protein
MVVAFPSTLPRFSRLWARMRASRFRWSVQFDPRSKGSSAAAGAVPERNSAPAPIKPSSLPQAQAVLNLQSVIQAEPFAQQVRKNVGRFLEIQERFKQFRKTRGIGSTNHSQLSTFVSELTKVPLIHLHQNPSIADKVLRMLTDYQVQPMLEVLRPHHFEHLLISNDIAMKGKVFFRIVPYQLAVRHLTSAVSCPVTKTALETDHEAEARYYELRGTENPSPAPIAPFMRWVEKDVYGKIKPMSHGALRIPIVTIMGHIDHGKTTLLDTLQSSAIAAGEPGLITQTIRAFTVDISRFGAVTSANIQRMTFIDTPGHKIFVEVRHSGQNVADVVLVLIALDEGIQGQTTEVLKSALVLKKPILILLNKVDLYTDPNQLSKAITSVAVELRRNGIELRLIDSIDTLTALTKVKPKTFRKHCVPPDDPPNPSIPAEGDKGKKATLRPALGICISGKKGTNIDLMLRCLQELFEVRRLEADSSQGLLQAKILESFKNERNNSLILNTVVRSGTAEKGIVFVADQNWGIIKGLTDQWGRPIQRATPGMAVNVLGCESAGAPGASTHLIEVSSVQVAKECFEYRRNLQRFVEYFHKHLALLRPRGLPVHFLHIGNYGQISDDKSLQFDLMWKNATAAEPMKNMTWEAAQHATPTRTEAEHEERMRNSEVMSIVAHTDSFHNGRLMVREIPRLGTRNITLQVIEATMKTIDTQLLQRFSNADLIISFRGKPLDDVDVAFHIESTGKPRYARFELFTEMVDYLKRFAVEKQQDFERRVREEGYQPSAAFKNKEYVMARPTSEAEAEEVKLRSQPAVESPLQRSSSAGLLEAIGFSSERTGATRKVDVRHWYDDEEEER